MHFRSRTAASVLLGFALVASACSAGDDTATVAEVADGPAEISTTAPVPAAPAETVPTQDTTQDSTQAAEPVEQAEQAEQEPATPAEEPVAAVPAEPEPTAPEAATVPLPAVDVYDLSTGETAALTSFARPGATLVWFWAPH